MYNYVNIWVWRFVLLLCIWSGGDMHYEDKYCIGTDFGRRHGMAKARS